MATAAILGGLLGAGGQIAPFFLENGSSSGNQTIIDTLPRNNLALQATQFDALNLLGFGDFGNVPGPFQQLAGDIQALGISNKFKRRGLRGLQSFRENFLDPVATLERERALEREKGLGFGLAPSGGSPVALLEFQKDLEGVLGRLGLSISDLDGILERQSQFEAQRTEQLKTAGALNQDTIQARLQAASAASKLLGSAAGFATSGEPQSNLQRQLLERLNRDIDDQEQQFLLRSQFGGFQPGAGLQQFQNQRRDVNLTALEQSLAAAAGLTSGLGSGLQLAQGSAAQSIGAVQGSASIAAAQAQAANALRAQQQQSLFGAAAGAGDALGSGIVNASILNSLQNQPDTDQSEFLEIVRELDPGGNF